MAGTGTQPITDRAQYFKQVLSPAEREGTLPDLFARYGLDIAEDRREVIDQQLSLIVKLWRNSTNHEKYGELVRRLIKEHPEAERTLRDDALRRAARRELQHQRTKVERAGADELESLIAELRTPGGELPESTRPQLRALGLELGLSESEIEAQLSRERFADDIGARRPVLEPARQREIAEHLASLRAVAHAADVGPTLFTVIDAPFSGSAAQLKALHATAVKRNDQRPYNDDAKSPANRVLVDVRRYLLEGDPDLYRAAVVADVKQTLGERVRRRRLVQDRIDQRTYRSLVADAIRLGLDEPWAELAIQELARAERIALDMQAPTAGERADGRAATPPVPPARGAAPPVPPLRGNSPPPVPPVRGTTPPSPPPLPPVRGTSPPPVPPLRGTTPPPVPPLRGATPPPVLPNGGTTPPVPPPRPPVSPRASGSPGLRASMYQRADFWWVPGLIPIFGAAISWLWAGAAARRPKYLLAGCAFLIWNLAAASAAKGASSGSSLVVLWIAGIYTVLRHRASVRQQISAHG